MCYFDLIRIIIVLDDKFKMFENLKFENSWQNK